MTQLRWFTVLDSGYLIAIGHNQAKGFDFYFAVQLTQNFLSPSFG